MPRWGNTRRPIPERYCAVEQDDKLHIDLLECMAQLELILLNWAEAYKDARQFVAFVHCGKALFERLKNFGISKVTYSQPKCLHYPTETSG